MDPVIRRFKKRYMAIGIVFILAGVVLYVLLGTDLLTKDHSGANLLPTDDTRPLVGFCIDTMVIERWQKDKDRFTAKAEELGFEVKVANAYEDTNRQIQQMRALSDDGAVAIVIIAFDKDSLEEVVDEAKKAGVVVIAYDRMTTNANVDAYVSFDNVKVGEYMASYLLDAAPTGNYVIINGSPADNNATMFNEGYYNILRPAIDRGDIEVSKEESATMWREDIAYDAIVTLLQEGVQIDAIIGANDRLAEAAISALSEYGLAGTIPVVGHDADISACQRIVEGRQLMTVYKPIKNLAEGAVEIMITLLEDGKVESDETIGDYNVPYIKFEVFPV
ncbi:MAG: substrate-binding domain-containing protein, partial [Vallitaleaceae bacterium]|nr:substrate-binding domain-containing protein [Vallitaleaceae bacterium]